MMFIVSKGYPDKSWHVGDRAPNLSPDVVMEIQADGDELEYIKRNFTNVPFHNSRRVMYWFGEMAQFIFANLDPKES